ncbi:hypothetical protein HHL24_03825 [Paraburkholderia sp. RP-4-7]|uniref:Uncharacterized protein n=1 Tax=Paraburkholderia polaris TaxID=2728848 RepID=A0A848I6J7_9BURK|nr:hypothetical protein [Paraburkholderia polaris]NML97089.1 hypothetical protein [Paraburkholderia polaris]
MKELLGRLANIVFPTMIAQRPNVPNTVDSAGKPVEIVSCYAYGASHDLVKLCGPPTIADRSA